MAKKSTKKSSTKRQRIERRFLPQSSSNPWLVRIPGALGAGAIGAGVWGYLYGHFVPAEGAGDAYNIPLFVLAGGAVALAFAIWFGTSGDAAIRVGDPGVAYEKGEPRRMPWWRAKSITFENSSESLLLTGTDERDAAFVFRIGVRSQPLAVAWVVKEAQERIPKKVDISDAVLARIGPAEEGGTKLILEPLQIVGRRCAASKKLIAYEPDGEVCPACERVYHKERVPRKCACGNEFSARKVTDGAASDGNEDDDDADDTTSADGTGERPKEDEDEDAKEKASAEA